MNRIHTESISFDFLTKKEKESLDHALSPVCGIVNAIMERNELRKFGIFQYQCVTAKAKTLFQLDREVSSGGMGIGETKRDALLACLGEAYERYAMSYYPAHQGDISCTFNELHKRQQPRATPWHTNAQYGSHRLFSNPRSEPVSWTKVRGWKRDSTIWWPTSLVYLPSPTTKMVAEATSTGVAAHTSVDTAMESGVLEVIERDALMLNFAKRLNPPEIILQKLPKSLAMLVKTIRQSYNIKIYSLYSDIAVPVFLGYIWRGQGKRFHFGIGAAAHYNSDLAIRKALQECLFTYYYSRNLMSLRFSQPSKIQRLYEHFLYYQRPMLFRALLFRSQLQAYCQNEVSAEIVARSVEDAGMTIYCKELTTPDILSLGIRVVRAIIPGMIDIQKTHSFPRLAAKRWTLVPKKLGIHVSGNLASLPHPFP